MKDIEAVESLLAEHPFLSGIAAKYHGFLSSCACVRRFASQQIVFQEGGEADHFYLIITGEVALETLAPGGGLVTVQRLTGGDVLGWSWLFGPYQWHFTASTLKPTEVISLSADALREKMADDRDFRDQLLSRMALTLYRRLLGAREQIVSRRAGPAPRQATVAT